MKRTVLILAASFLVCGGAAQTAVLQSFDRLFQGDDPTEGFTFSPPYDPSTPGWLRFDGFAENLAPDETGVRFLLRWTGADVTSGSELFFPGEPYFGGVRLPGVDAAAGTTRVPLHFGAMIDYSPGGVWFVVEGLGPGDYFRFVGDLTLQPVPEPGTWALLTLGFAGWLAMRRWAGPR